jgi:predicted cupin superfamily sugar epimerase
MCGLGKGLTLFIDMQNGITMKDFMNNSRKELDNASMMLYFHFQGVWYKGTNISHYQTFGRMGGEGKVTCQILLLSSKTPTCKNFKNGNVIKKGKKYQISVPLNVCKGSYIYNWI